MRIGIAQIKPRVGDFKYNVERIYKYYLKGKENQVDLVVFPELSVSGYLHKDLIYRPEYAEDVYEALQQIKEFTELPAILIGIPTYHARPSLKGVNLHDPSYKTERNIIRKNRAVVVKEHKIFFSIPKTYRPDYDIYDEKRYYVSGRNNTLLEVGEEFVGVTVCEDIWVENGPVEKLSHKRNKPSIIVNISASPFFREKFSIRSNLLKKLARKFYVDIAYVNQVGAVDDVIFDGRSMVVNKEGETVWVGKVFEEDFGVLDIPLNKGDIGIVYDDTEELFKALSFGIKEYVENTGLKGVVLGLSGGVDSALVSVLAKDALGKNSVKAFIMPAPPTSELSVKLAEKLAKNLKIEYFNISINNILKSYIDELNFVNEDYSIVEQNLQARIRANILMAYANKHNLLLLSTGNKSEIAAGYNTIYGDLAGGLAPIGDIFKHDVYELIKFYNSKNPRALVPNDIVTRSPSAELKPSQKDEDDLPPYSIVDAFYKEYIENYVSYDELSEKFGQSVTDKLLWRLKKSEFKRRQAPIILKVSSSAFGPGRRIPVSHFYKYA